MPRKDKKKKQKRQKRLLKAIQNIIKIHIGNKKEKSGPQTVHSMPYVSQNPMPFTRIDATYGGINSGFTRVEPQAPPVEIPTVGKVQPLYDDYQQPERLIEEENNQPMGLEQTTQTDATLGQEEYTENPSPTVGQTPTTWEFNGPEKGNQEDIPLPPSVIRNISSYQIGDIIDTDSRTSYQVIGEEGNTLILHNLKSNKTVRHKRDYFYKKK